MKKKTFFALSAAIWTAALGASEVYPISSEAKDWSNFRFFSQPNENAVVSNLEENGKKVLRVTFTKKPGIKDVSASAYRKFTPPLDTGKYTNFRFKVRFSEEVSSASVTFYYKGWEKEGWKKMQSVSLGDSVRSKILPKGQWLDIDVSLKYKELEMLFLGLLIRDFKEGEKVMADFQFMEFYTPEIDASLAAKRAEWQNFVKNFKADYSDGKDLMEPSKTNRFATPVCIVKDGKPMAEIWYDKSYNGEPVETAAKELQYHVKLMTGAELPINQSLRKPGITKIVLGRNNKTIWRPFLFGKELDQLFGSDGFLIRKIGDELFVLGQNDKGTLNGVYTLIENNTDLIWARPNRQHGTVCSTGLKDLDFVWGDQVLDKPASKIRGYMTFAPLDWIARSRCNSMTGGGGENYWSFASAKKYGPARFYARGGHNVGEFVNVKNPEGDDPSFYGLVNGQRKRGNHVCFSNPKMREYYINTFLNIYKRLPSDISGANLWLDDTWDWCECPGCNAPVKLPDGTVVERKDPAYTSTVAFLFFNQIAEAYVKEFPGKRIRVGAYWQTAEPPKCELHPAIVPMFCPYVRTNDKAPVYSPENIVWLDRLQRWAKKAGTIEIYGYNALGYNFPRPLAHTHKRDFKEYYQYVIGISAEGTTMCWGDDPTPTNNMNTWDYSAIEFWVMNRLYWNPDQDVEKLYKQFCYRAFREAAVPMEKFYGTIREEFLHSPLATTIGEFGTTATNDYIILTGKENELRACLKEAEKLAVHPNSKWMISRIRDRFEFYIDKVKSAKTPSITLPLIRPDKPVTFDSPVWDGAAKLENLTDYENPKKPAGNKTQIAMFHDAKNLYFRIRCFEPDLKSMALTKNSDGKEFMGGTHVEIFLADAKTPGEYYLFGICPDGNSADYKGYDIKWNSHWKHEARMFDKGYEVLAVIPMKDINANLNEISQLRGTIAREVYGKTKADTEYSTWNGGKHHQTNTFGTFQLMK